MADAIETRGSRSHRRGDSLVQFLEQEPAVAEERAVSLTPSPSKLMTSVTETLFHRPAAPPLEELPTEALERELHRRRSVSPRPAADQSNGLSDESDGADSMSDDASFVHGDDDLDSNGTLSPIPSRSTTPSFMMRPDPSRVSRPILPSPCGSGGALLTSDRSSSRRRRPACDFRRRPFVQCRLCLRAGSAPTCPVAVEPVHRASRGRHDELEAHRVAALVRVVRQRGAGTLTGTRSTRPSHAEDLVARRSPRRWPTDPASGGCSTHGASAQHPRRDTCAGARARPRRTPAATVAAADKVFALHQRDNYGRQALDEDCQHKEQKRLRRYLSI